MGGGGGGVALGRAYGVCRVGTVGVNKYSVIWHHFSHTKHPNTYLLVLYVYRGSILYKEYKTKATCSTQLNLGLDFGFDVYSPAISHSSLFTHHFSFSILHFPSFILYSFSVMGHGTSETYSLQFTI